MPTTISDPGRELAELCDRLYAPHNATPGATYLSSLFGVEAWSREFYQIVFCILDRIQLVVDIIQTLELDDDHKAEAVTHAVELKSAFNNAGLAHPWSQTGNSYISPRNVQPIKMLSPLVRQRMSYPKLSGEDVDELKAEVDQLLDWLQERQLAEHDFIRQALIEGLEQLAFRLKKLEWLGYGYAVASLREVIAAYMALERAVTDLASQPDAAAVLQKSAATIKKVYEKIKVAKGVYDVGDFVLKAYGAASLAMKAYPGIAGLLPSHL